MWTTLLQTSVFEFLRGAHLLLCSEPYPGYMAHSSLHMAALASSAVADFEPTGARVHSYGGNGDFVSAVVTSAAQDVIVRIPRNSGAEVTQSGEILGQTALTAGVRRELTFAVPEVLGMTRAGDTRAVVSTYIEGDPLPLQQLSEDSAILPSLSAALTSLHGLPPAFVQQAGLPVLTAESARIETSRLVDRAHATRLVPTVLHDAWTKTLRDAEVWDFAPVVIHGGLQASQVLFVEDQVTGLLGFDRLKVGDPAEDFAWLLGAGEEVFTAVLDGYSITPTGAEHLKRRAALMHELEVAKWLLHGHDTHDQAVIDDAVAMMDRLVDRHMQTAPAVVSATSTEEAEDALDEVPEVTRVRSDTEAFEGLDDERVFTPDEDFAEPEHRAQSENLAEELSSVDRADADASEGSETGEDDLAADVTEAEGIDPETDTEVSSEDTDARPGS